MQIEFSPIAGPRERHLKRKYRNPLFSKQSSRQPHGQSEEIAPLSQDAVLAAREQDETELDHFLRYFRDLVQEAIELESNTDSDVVLDLKERLDKCYIHCCALPGDQSKIKSAVSKLVEVIMTAVRQGAANDPVAQSKLEEEDIARRMHNELAEHTLVADLLLPDSPIDEDELVATLLSETSDSLQAALGLFDAEHISEIYQQARGLIESLDPDNEDHQACLEVASKNLALIERVLGNSVAALNPN